MSPPSNGSAQVFFLGYSSKSKADIYQKASRKTLGWRKKSHKSKKVGNFAVLPDCAKNFYELCGLITRLCSTRRVAVVKKYFFSSIDPACHLTCRRGEIQEAERESIGLETHGTAILSRSLHLQHLVFICNTCKIKWCKWKTVEQISVHFCCCCPHEWMSFFKLDGQCFFPALLARFGTCSVSTMEASFVLAILGSQGWS